MSTISIQVGQSDVYEEVAKATDYTGSKLIGGDEDARDRILAQDDDFRELGRFWDETIAAAEEWLKELFVSGETETDEAGTFYTMMLEVSSSWDTTLARSVQSTLRSYFIASIIGQWFKFANKGEAADYLTSAGEMLQNAERLLYARKRPQRPTD